MDFDDLVSPNPLVDGNITANSQSYHIFIAIGSVENRENLLDMYITGKGGRNFEHKEIGIKYSDYRTQLLGFLRTQFFQYQ